MLPALLSAQITQEEMDEIEKTRKFKDDDQTDADEIEPCSVNPGGSGTDDSTYYYPDANIFGYQYSTSPSSSDLTEEEILRLKMLATKED